MVIFTTKLTKGKKLGVLIVLGVLAAALVLALTGDSDPTKGLGTNEDRVEYLAQCGLTVDPEPIQVRQVTVPEEGSELMQRYNSLQLEQGFDLSDYAGHRVRQYVFHLSGGPEDSTVTMLQSGSRLIGGDITLTGDSPRMQGLPRLEKENLPN